MTADELVSRARSFGSIASNSSLTDQKIIDEANTELFTRLAPMIRRLSPTFFRAPVNDTALVASTARYPIPSRAFDNGLEIIKYLDANSNEGYALVDVSLRRVGRPRWPSQWASDATAQYPTGYWLDQGNIVITPTPGTTVTGSLRLYWLRRPSKLVLDATSAAQHTAVATVTSVSATVITCAAAHNGFPANHTIDIMQAKAPYKLLGTDITVSAAAAGTSITVSGTTLTSLGIVAGDFVTLADQAYVPWLPVEWHELFIDMTVARLFSKLGDLKSEQALRVSINERVGLMRAATTPRVSSAAPRLNPFQ